MPRPTRKTPARRSPTPTKSSSTFALRHSPFELPAWSGGDPALPGTRNLLALHLASLTIHTANFRSSSFENRREGAVRFDCCGQTTLWAFHDTTGKDGQATVSLKGSPLLYLGIHPRRISLGVNVIESDEEVRKALQGAADVARALGSTPLASLHPAVSPGSALLSGLLTTIKSQIRDDLEYQFFAVYDDPLRHGMRLALDGKNSAGNTVLSAEIEVIDFGEVRAGDPVSVRVAAPVIEFTSDKVDGASRQGPSWAARPGGRNLSLSKTPRQWFDHLQAHWLSCESANGASRFQWSARFGDTPHTLDWHQAELFVASTGTSSRLENRHLIPFSLAFSLVPQQLQPDALLGLASQSLDFAAAFEPGAKQAAAYLKKSEPVLGPVLAHLAGKAVDLFSFEGLLFLLPENSPAPIPNSTFDIRNLSQATVLALPWDPASQSWKTPGDAPPHPILFQGKTIGSITLRLQARPLREIKN